MILLIPKGTVLKDIHANIDERDRVNLKVLDVEHYEKNYISCPLQGADIELLNDVEFWMSEDHLDKNDVNFGCEYADMVSKNETQIQYIEISTVIGFKTEDKP